ncbi:MAG TPA: hypothetical protein VGR87_12685 [Candidatus Limnocylindria bacterium]|jgi:hypothetical protein|nr:hypothetical protein [Candidatus Limnocylindria bacterium]
MLAKALERFTKLALSVWRDLSLDAQVVALLGVGNWVLLFANHTTVAATHDVPLWQLFPPGADVAFLIACGALAFAYPFRDHRARTSFTTRARVLHLIGLIGAFVIVPALASIVLRETGKPYTYVHDGALMVEEAARKFLHGMNPYVADYLDTPMFFWPMINNPALYHLTYFPFMFLVTTPFVWLFDHAGIIWDQRFLYLPAYLGTLALVPLLVQGAARRLALTAAIALNPQLFPFVVEGRNDFFVLLFLFAGLALLMRERRTASSLAFAAAGAAKLHALFVLPFVAVYLVATKRPRTLREAVAALAPTWPAALFLLATFLPFLLNDFDAFYDDVVRYNAGGAAWTYPISGMGFSALLLSLGLIPYRQADFPFAAIEIAVAAPIAAWWLLRLWQRPTIATLLAGYALTLLAFLFFGRYFQGNYLGFIAAVFTPVPFLALRDVRRVRRLRRVEGIAAARGSLRPAPSVVTGPAPAFGPTPAAHRDAPSAPSEVPSAPSPERPPPVPVTLEAPLAEPSPAGAASAD